MDSHIPRLPVRCAEAVMLGLLYLCASPSASRAETDYSSANWIMLGCRHTAPIVNATISMARATCNGAVGGIASASPTVCSPSEATVGQMMRVVVIYIDQRPARLHEDFNILANEALTAAWPCR